MSNFMKVVINNIETSYRIKVLGDINFNIKTFEDIVHK